MQDFTTHHPLFRSVLPPADTGGTFSIFVVAGFLPAAVPRATAAFFIADGPFFAAGFETIVVPALVLLASLLRPSASEAAAGPRLTSRLIARAASDGLTGLVGRGRPKWAFSGEPPSLNGERGRVRELWDLGDRTVDGTTFFDAVHVALVFAGAATVFDRFFGLGRSCEECSAGMFSLSSVREMWSLSSISTCWTCHVYGIAHLCRFKLFRVGASTGLAARAGDASFLAGTGGAGAGLALSACSSSKSCIFRLRNACGMRLTRSSRRARRPCACNAYCARSLRARSVTARRVNEAYLEGVLIGPTYSRAADCRAELASALA